MVCKISIELYKFRRNNKDRIKVDYKTNMRSVHQFTPEIEKKSKKAFKID